MNRIIFEKDFSRHPLHYFTLLCVQVIGLWGLFWYAHQPRMQLAIIISMGVSYVVWGIIHHYDHRDLHIKIIAEYILIALLAVLIFGTLLINS
ncbi:MAG: hypothetical protein UX91_C0006G0028 [Candidatus Amesbacteria bacterium GW2011_GWB1_47_19]|nr:MAG: hypothetical protein UW51_C0002G0028 [Candidatus Amesbacteria bacterium GW2011_GWA1_44_24]KKU31382.1 MAG: hypothetical protein UX46_C0006G0174 [Candidatus Amesbacteria bacterium GW2011_GWC1_46_24]KKU66966.1 MAG: hypothetical protein UX91_C0006G0028 [Candidatus Amesbacteria bacterium GW2011_GWB1_47_19]OGD06414.1 MAG: hypothetical protein A2379_02115 [Candidatus Amesbacteria bacterium RIFOXYB1_FULL_47_13]HBC72816.1 hypothetical protein [Candidatus Amesbacteria bacterium]